MHFEVNMLNEIIESILDAEREAEKIIQDALEEAKTMNANAVVEADKIKNDTIQKVKDERRLVISTAEKEAEESYDEIIALGKKQAEKILRDTKTAGVAQCIKEKVLKKYGNC